MHSGVMSLEQARLAALDKQKKRAVVSAREHADAVDGREVGAYHLLKGLLSVRHGLAARAVRAVAGSRAGQHPDPVRREHPSPVHLPVENATEHAFTRTTREATRMGDGGLGASTLLLGLYSRTSRATRGAALGVDQQRARGEISRLRATG